jgi:hypothetical protein
MSWLQKSLLGCAQKKGQEEVINKRKGIFLGKNVNDDVFFD